MPYFQSRKAYRLKDRRREPGEFSACVYKNSFDQLALERLRRAGDFDVGSEGSHFVCHVKPSH